MALEVLELRIAVRVIGCDGREAYAVGIVARVLVCAVEFVVPDVR